MKSIAILPNSHNRFFRPCSATSAIKLEAKNFATLPAVKMPLPVDGDFAGELATLRSVTRASFSIGYSGDWGAKDALLAGADGWFSVIAGLLPRDAMQLARAAIAADVG